MKINKLDHRLCIAPMMDWTDRHCRAFHRLLTRRARLYTEMLTTGAVLHGDRERLLGFDAAEHPVALQLGGAEPAALAAAAAIGAARGYDEINLNVGCPSDRVQSGRFGACLMREPALVGDCVAAMIGAVDVPVTVKCRLGVDEQEPRESLFALVDACASAGARVFIVHARKAWLRGLSPKENREVPPLDYALVRRLKRERPALTVVLNGGLTSLEDAAAELAHVDGVMFGRAAYHNPAMLCAADRRLCGAATGDTDPVAAVRLYLEHVRREQKGGTPLTALARPLIGLFHGRPGARAWRRRLTVDTARPGVGAQVIESALAEVAGWEEAELFRADGRSAARQGGHDPRPPGVGELRPAGDLGERALAPQAEAALAVYDADLDAGTGDGGGGGHASRECAPWRRPRKVDADGSPAPFAPGS